MAIIMIKLFKFSSVYEKKSPNSPSLEDMVKGGDNSLPQPVAMCSLV